MRGIPGFDALAAWVRSLDSAWLFLVILALVVAVIVIWSSSLRSDDAKERKEDESRT
jgi:hypothetical protein